ncbi:MAG TPA: hypothetical protein VFB03_01570 [Candidatus Saccharimonadales bacterium]|nr:hypothetical protein [Candidatus Saccharimonadales bacterium]
MRRLFFGFLAFIILLFLIIWLWPHSPKKPQTVPTGVVLQPLPDYAQYNSSVSLISDGIINGNELHRAIRISVDNNLRTVDVLQGYNYAVIDSHSFANTPEAYSTFLRSISNFGFLAKQPHPKVSDDPAGQCPLGTRYLYRLTKDDNELFSSWSSSCGSAVGTSAAGTSSLLTLFQRQIPDYSKLTSKVSLSLTSPPAN